MHRVFFFLLLAELALGQETPSSVLWWDHTGLALPLPPGVTNVVSVGAGERYCVALRADSSALCWSVTGQVVSAPNLTNVVQIDAGSYHALALLKDGSMTGWGNNYAGQAKGPGGNDYIAISTGMEHNLALRKNGTVVEWGRFYNVPPGLSNVIAIAAGGFHSVALKADGTIVAWAHSFEQWGQTNVPSDLSNVVAIAAGHNCTLALKGDGTVVTMGGPAVPSGLTNVIAISAGRQYNLALTRDGGVVRWGWGAVPVGLSNVTAISASYTNDLAILGGGRPHITLPPEDQTIHPNGRIRFNVRALGCPPLSYQWQLDGTNIPGATNVFYDVARFESQMAGRYTICVSNISGPPVYSDAQLSEVPVAAWGHDLVSKIPKTITNVVAIYGGYDSALVLKKDGNLDAWGGNAFLYTNIPPDLTNVVSLAVHRQILAVQDHGRIVAWGDNTWGKATVPTDVTNVASAAAGYFHSLALLKNGTIRGWGMNSYGQLDIPPGLSNVVAIAAGMSYSLALKNDGTVAVVGRFPGGTNFPNDVVAIASGNVHCLLLRRDGTVSAFGDNYSYGLTNVPPGLSNAVAIAAGEQHSVALQADGTVRIWGAQSQVPSELRNVTAIGGGFNHTLAIVGDGSPVITLQPQGRTATLGSSVQLTAFACGTPPLAYQWRKDGVMMQGETNCTLSLETINRQNSGTYSVEISNRLGIVTSKSTTVTVAIPQRLQNPETLPDGSFAFCFRDSDGTPLVSGTELKFHVEGSSNLVDWIPVPATFVLTNGNMRFVEPEPPLKSRFYRVLER